MFNDMSRRRFVATAIGGVTALAMPNLAFGCKPKTLTLKSRYTGERTFGDARTVTLVIKWREDGRSDGLLTLDPNITDGFMSTCIAIQEVPMEATLLLETQPIRNPTRYYELRERDELRKVKSGKECWRLEELLTKNPTYMLEAIDKDGKVSATIELFE